MNNMSKNWKSAIFYILIPVLLVVLAVVIANQQKTTDVKYSQIVNLFKTNQVCNFELDLTSGQLTYYTFDKPKEEKEYKVPSVTYFIEDIRESINEYNDANPNAQIEYNYKQSSSRNWVFNLLPYLVILVGGSLLVWFMMKRMGDTMNNETNRTLSFGRVRTKNIEDKNKKTFADVAGCEEVPAARRRRPSLKSLWNFLRTRRNSPTSAQGYLRESCS